MSTSVYDKIIEKAKLDASKIIADGTEKVKELDLLTKEEVEKEKSAALKDASLKDEERVLVYKASLEQSFNQQRLAHQKELLQKVIDQTKQELMNLSDNELIAFVKNHIRKANIEKAIIKVNEKDYDRYVKLFSSNNNQMLDTLGDVSLAKDSVDISGGFIIENEYFDIDNSFEVILDEIKDKYESALAKMLFE
ncbi:MAG: V-type ATP synthase subunit E [Bacilli bacterium]|nr:V-type ATP synthase subunit E [Bacilli bacterium]